MRCPSVTDLHACPQDRGLAESSRNLIYSLLV